MSNFDDYDIDPEDLFDKKNKKKKNSKDKGKRGEAALVKLLNERFNTQAFSRVVGSGNRWSQVAFVSKDYIGDVVCPSNFKFVIECKFGYPEIDLQKALSNGDTQIDNFLKQSKEDGKRAGKYSLLCWKRDRYPWVSFVHSELLPQKFEYEFVYRNWTIVLFSCLLDLDNQFFFD